MSDLVTVIRAIIQDEFKSLRLGDLAVVTSTFPHADASDNHNYECNVKLRESDLVLRQVPMVTPHVGAVSAPRVGDLVMISYVAGDANRPIVIGRLYSDEANPPLYEENEWRVEAPFGGDTSIAIDKDEAVLIKTGTTEVKLNKDSTVEIKGDEDLSIEVQGNVAITCADCTIDASGNVDLGTGGDGVITEGSHKCYFTGAPLVGSQTVKAKG